MKAERELRCLYDVARAAMTPGGSMDEILRAIAAVIPEGWQHPQAAAVRIILDAGTYASPGFQESPWKLDTGIVTNGKRRGSIEVFYKTEPAQDEGPFSKSGRSLLEEIARQVGLLVAHREAQKEKLDLEQQLRHADRLATIGEMAAEAAHELNEPLGSILGFAQLAKNSPNLPVKAEQDLEKIINAALHAREVIKKLLLYARKLPIRRVPCNLNRLVSEGMYFLESRCARQGITLVRKLDDRLPEILADSGQVHQVLINLVVNAIQAMPRGGTLTILTAAEKGQVKLMVEDTGVGMSKAVMNQVFVPFFTTKDAGQGTGLGLSVVRGIVSSHGGVIQVESQRGKGSRFVVSLPLTGIGKPEEKP